MARGNIGSPVWPLRAGKPAVAAEDSGRVIALRRRGRQVRAGIALEVPMVGARRVIACSPNSITAGCQGRAEGVKGSVESLPGGWAGDPKQGTAETLTARRSASEATWDATRTSELAMLAGGCRGARMGLAPAPSAEREPGRN